MWFNTLIAILIMMESGGNPNAYNPREDAVGILQLRKVYVDEVNSISDKHFSYSDRWSVDKSVEMFIIINQYHNPDWDLELALHIHNAGAYNIKKRWHLTKKYRNRYEKFVCKFTRERSRWESQKDIAAR